MVDEYERRFARQLDIESYQIRNNFKKLKPMWIGGTWLVLSRDTRFFTAGSRMAYEFIKGERLKYIGIKRDEGVFVRIFESPTGNRFELDVPKSIVGLDWNDCFDEPEIYKQRIEEWVKFWREARLRQLITELVSDSARTVQGTRS